MKTLQELGLNHKNVKAVCVSFNNANLVKDKIKTVGITGEAMLVMLVKLIDTVPDVDMVKIPGDVSAFYSALPEEIFNTNIPAEVVAGATDAAPAAAAVPATTKKTGKGTKKTAAPAGDAPADATAGAAADDATGVTPEEVNANAGRQSDCPIYGTGWNPKELVCQECKKVFHLDYVGCKRQVKGIVVSKNKKSEASKRPTTTRKTASSQMLSRYGHRINTMAALIDDMVWVGSTFDAMVKKIMLWHDRDEASAKAKLRSHFPWLQNVKGVAITNDNGVYKAAIEYMDGQFAENTAAAEPAVELQGA